MTAGDRVHIYMHSKRSRNAIAYVVVSDEYAICLAFDVKPPFHPSSTLTRSRTRDIIMILTRDTPGGPWRERETRIAYDVEIEES